MGAFKIEIVGVGGHGCDRKAQSGDKLYQRCGRFGCPDCMAANFVQELMQRGMLSKDGSVNMVELQEGDPIPDGAVEYFLPVTGSDAHERGLAQKRYAKFPHVATFTHWPDTPTQVVDDMLKNERKAGSF